MNWLELAKTFEFQLLKVPIIVLLLLYVHSVILRVIGNYKLQIRHTKFSTLTNIWLHDGHDNWNHGLKELYRVGYITTETHQN